VKAKVAAQILLIVLSWSLALLAQTSAASSDSINSSSSSSGSNGETRHGIGVAANASTLGLGADVGVGLTPKLTLRGGFHAFSYDRSFNRDGINYQGTFDMKSGQVLLDWFPTGRGFHLSPGMLVYNGNRFDANAAVSGGQTFSLGGNLFRSNPANPTTGNGKLEFNKVAPLVVFGFGNLVPRSRHFTAAVDLGVAYPGTPTASLSLAGSACAPNGANCRDAATDPTVQSSLQSEVAKLNRDAESYKVYPILSVGFGYKF
jgi:hypothetical protein